MAKELIPQNNERMSHSKYCATNFILFLCQYRSQSVQNWSPRISDGQTHEYLSHIILGISLKYDTWMPHLFLYKQWEIRILVMVKSDVFASVQTSSEYQIIVNSVIQTIPAHLTSKRIVRISRSPKFWKQSHKDDRTKIFELSRKWCASNNSEKRNPHNLNLRERETIFWREEYCTTLKKTALFTQRLDKFCSPVYFAI